MEVTKIGEYGFDQACYGLSLSYKDRAIPRYLWWPCTIEDKEKFSRLAQHEIDYVMQRITHFTKRVAPKQAGRGGGHDKFLEHIEVWIDIEAPRYWWSEFDTYRVGMSKQSESTMHSLSKRDLIDGDFEDGCPYCFDISLFNNLRRKQGVSIRSLKEEIPEGYLQRREVKTNYKVLHNIINQRKAHKLPEWKVFIDEVYSQVDHPELLQRREVVDEK
jgi:hypothetical protein